MQHRFVKLFDKSDRTIVETLKRLIYARKIQYNFNLKYKKKSKKQKTFYL